VCWRQELEPVEKWVSALELNASHRAGEGTGCYLNVMVCFDGKDKDRKVLIGGIVFEYYFPSNTALITYLVTNPNVRGQGRSGHPTREHRAAADACVCGLSMYGCIDWKC
jgi:hypothetical protein